MSKSGIPIVKDIALQTGKVIKRIGNVKNAFKPGEQPDADGLPTRAGPSDPSIEKRATTDFATRDQQMQRQAAAAGATRSENDADLLGYTGPKKKSAARQTLGL
jgi:hypothetical protein